MRACVRLCVHACVHAATAATVAGVTGQRGQRGSGGGDRRDGDSDGVRACVHVFMHVSLQILIMSRECLWLLVSVLQGLESVYRVFGMCGCVRYFSWSVSGF
jgi:hypothetical protein